MSDIVNVRSTIAANGGVVVIRTGGMPVVGIELEGTWAGTLHLQETVSGDGFVDAQATNAAGTPVSAVVTGNGKFFVAAAGRSAIQVIATAWGSGTATVIGVPTEGSAGGSSGGQGGGAVTIADGADTALGTTTDAGIITNIAGTVIGFLRGSIIQWAAFLARFPAALGGTTAANSLPVTLSSDGQFVTSTGSLTETAPATDIASSGLNGRLQRVAQRLTSLIGLLPTALGSTTAANSLPVTLSTDGQFTTSTGSLTETAPATDIASSGLNGRLQRVAQRLTSLIALLPTALVSNRLDVNLGAAPATVTTQGAGASGAALAGNPVRVGISDATNAQDWRQMVFTTANAATGYPGVALLSSNGTTLDPVKNDGGGANASLRVNIGSGGSLAAVGALADANGSAGLKVYAAQMGYNGTNNDNWRNNVDVTLLASAARTTTQSGTITTYNLGAIKFILDMTVITAGPSVTLTISETDLASGKTVLLLSGAAVVTAVTNEYTVDPMVPAVANVSAQKRVPRTIFWQVTANNNNSGQYSLGSFQLPA